MAQEFIRKIYDELFGFFGPQNWWPGDSPFEVMIGAILTQNTSWKNVEKAIKNLKSAKALSSPSAFNKLSEKRLSGLIRPAGFYNVKAKRLRSFLAFLSDNYGLKLANISRRETARLKNELLNVKGIGPETCDSILLYALNRPVFVVDAYTKRILKRHRIIGRDCDYDTVQKLFMDNLPRKAALFNEYHALLVRLGKDFCRAVPKCEKCPLDKFKNACK